MLDGLAGNLERYMDLVSARLLAENALRFSIAATLVRGRISQVRAAIQEGRPA